MKKLIKYKISADSGNGDLKTAQQSKQQMLIIFKNFCSKSFKVLQEGFKYLQVLKLAKEIDCSPMIAAVKTSNKMCNNY